MPPRSATRFRSHRRTILDGSFSRYQSAKRFELLPPDPRAERTRSGGGWSALATGGPDRRACRVVYGNAQRDANSHRFLKTCIIEPIVSQFTARRATEPRRRARAGFAVDALVVALAEPGGTVLTGDRADIEALATHADRVRVHVI